jgi:hypothetical protein
MLETLVRNLCDLLVHAIRVGPETVLVLHDTRSALSRLLTAGYRRALPQGDFLDVDAAPAEELLARVEALVPGDLVVLVESTRFELKQHRFRLFLFQRGLKVVEHPHLGRMNDAELGIYVDSLAYDPDHLRPLGRALKACLDRADRIRLLAGSEELVYGGPFEDAKLNVGDYAASKQVGGQFPIGEVFTEAVDLERCHGRVPIFAYGESDFSVRRLETALPLVIQSGRVVAAPGAPRGFLDVLEAIRAAEGEVWVRELGFGLNRAFSKERTVTDVGSYERVCGVHLSLGAKHAVYPKAGFSRKETKFHVDVFCDLEQVEVGDQVVWESGRYLLP